MARIIEFHIPAGVRPEIESVPPQERGPLIVFPSNLTRSASGASAFERFKATVAAPAVFMKVLDTSAARALRVSVLIRLP